MNHPATLKSIMGNLSALLTPRATHGKSPARMPTGEESSPSPVDEIARTAMGKAEAEDAATLAQFEKESG